MWKDENLEIHFKKAKRLLAEAANLAHPDPRALLALTCDASRIGLGAVLEQFIHGQWTPLGYWSNALKGRDTVV